MSSMSSKSVTWNPPLAKGDLGGFIKFEVRGSGCPEETVGRSRFWRGRKPMCAMSGRSRLGIAPL